MSVRQQMINRPAVIHQHHMYGSDDRNVGSTNSFLPTVASNDSHSYASLTYTRSDQLRVRIHENHLSYLSRDETPSKFELRNKLETLVTEYISMIPHSHKFSYREIGDCLTASIKRSADFDPRKAICAFEAIERYATNLLNYPWRHEFRTIFAFSGFFYRTIECVLSNHRAILNLLGFTFDSSTSVYKLTEIPIDPDKVTKISLECLVAIVECKIMLNIHQTIKSQFADILWSDIYSVRSDYVCNTENAIKLIRDLKITGKLIDLDLPDYNVKKFHKLDLFSPSNNCNRTILNNESYATTNSNNDVAKKPTKIYLESNLDSLDFIDGPSNDVSLEPTYSSPASTSVNHSLSASNSGSNVLSLSDKHARGPFSSDKSLSSRNVSSVPAAQIDEKVISYNPSNDIQLSNPIAASPTNSDSITASPSLNLSTIDKPIDDDNKYSKIDSVLLSEINQFENNRKNVFAPPSNTKKAFIAADRRFKVLTGINGEHKKSEKPIGSMQIVNLFPKNVKPDVAKSNSTYSGIEANGLKKTENEKIGNASEQGPISNSEKWSCPTCTYQNNSNKKNPNICEMCHRTRVQDPLPTVTTYSNGGRECFRCTLVNQKDDKFCKVCSTRL